jgi:hypothetical protein
MVRGDPKELVSDPSMTMDRNVARSLYKSGSSPRLDDVLMRRGIRLLLHESTGHGFGSFYPPD